MTTKYEERSIEAAYQQVCAAISDLALVDNAVMGRAGLHVKVAFDKLEEARASFVKAVRILRQEAR